jgi:phage tail sheath protein FI
MPVYLSPGVYIEEIPSGARPIEGVSTSTAAFVGPAERGPAGEAVLIGKLDDYKATYGDIVSETDAMGLAVQAFYLNGGKAAYICRIAGGGAAAASAEILGEGSGGTPTGTRSW